MLIHLAGSENQFNLTTQWVKPNAPPGFQQTLIHTSHVGSHGHQQALYSAAVQNQSASSGSTSQETQLPHAFNTLTYRIRLTQIGTWILVVSSVNENKCTIEFDEFGFSVKDFWTRQILLRCDSTGDLYPVTSPSYPQAFLVWTAIVAPYDLVIRGNGRVLGKHVRLPFSLSETIVKAPFDIIHSDLWTSPFTSVSGTRLVLLQRVDLYLAGIDVADETF
ncbi:hypothetical protein Tco_0449143 [Tanacetum coccineum]